MFGQVASSYVHKKRNDWHKFVLVSSFLEDFDPVGSVFPQPKNLEHIGQLKKFCSPVTGSMASSAVSR